MKKKRVIQTDGLYRGLFAKLLIIRKKMLMKTKMTNNLFIKQKRTGYHIQIFANRASCDEVN